MGTQKIYEVGIVQIDSKVLIPNVTKYDLYFPFTKTVNIANHLSCSVCPELK